jgi:hypothetical protein
MPDQPPEDIPPPMIGLPPSARGLSGRPADIAEHASQVAHEWEDMAERYIHERMRQFGISENMNGQPDYEGGGRWHTFSAHGLQGGENTTGVVSDSGVLNPDLLKGQKGGRLWAKSRLRDRIDSAVSHEYEELRQGGSHAAALKAAAKTELPISDMARRINRARAR